MTILRGRNFLMTPGPTNIPDRILSAMHKPAVDLYSQPFIDLCQSCLVDLAPVFQTESDVFIYPCNGHGAWEAALANPLRPGEKVLIPEVGFFALAWGEAARQLGLEIELVPGDWRNRVAVDRIEAALRADTAHEIGAVLLVHVDTGSGLVSDVPSVREAIDRVGHPAILIVDAVASLGGSEFKMDEWGVDVAVAASQKALMMPPGFGFTAVSERAIAKRRGNTRELFYWDWMRRRSELWYDWFCGTAPEHLIFGLREALDMLAEEGLSGVVRRHHRLSRAVLAALEVWSQAGGLERNVRIESECSSTITTVLVAEGIDARGLVSYLSEELNVSFGGGMGKLAGRAFRIAHMGDVNEPMMLGALACLEKGLAVKGIPYNSGGVEAAIRALTVDP